MKRAIYGSRIIIIKTPIIFIYNAFHDNLDNFTKNFANPLKGLIPVSVHLVINLK